MCSVCVCVCVGVCACMSLCVCVCDEMSVSIHFCKRSGLLQDRAPQIIYYYYYYSLSVQLLLMFLHISELNQGSSCCPKAAVTELGYPLSKSKGAIPTCLTLCPTVSQTHSVPVPLCPKPIVYQPSWVPVPQCPKLEVYQSPCVQNS